MNGILVYGLYHYKYASGREGDWFVVGLASQKNYVSLYTCACDKDGYLAENNQDRLGKASVGRSCILQGARRLELEGGAGAGQESRPIGLRHRLMAVRSSVCTGDFIQLHCFIVSRPSQKISMESSVLTVVAADI